MTEQELVDFGFDKVEVSDDESQNGYDYYYYNSHSALTEKSKNQLYK